MLNSHIFHDPQLKARSGGAMDLLRFVPLTPFFHLIYSRAYGKIDAYEDDDLPTNAMLGNRIAEARMLKAYSVKEVARQMSVTEKTFEKWESGKSKPRANKMQMLAGVLGVSLVWMLDGEKQFEPEANSPSQLENLGLKVERITQLQQELSSLTDEVVSEVEELQMLEEDLDILKN